MADPVRRGPAAVDFPLRETCPDRAILRNAGWLTAERAVAAGRVLLGFWVGLALTVPFLGPGMQVARDFGAFWTAAGLALSGHASAAYGPAAPAALTGLFGPGRHPSFFYPPPALLLWLPLALLPFAAAAAVWLVASGTAYTAAISVIAGRGSVALALAFPAVPVCALYGQNALLSAALFGAAGVALERRPVLAGFGLGCLIYKPQLAVLVPVALAAAARWRALAAAAATAAALAGGSLVAFGPQAWGAFFTALPDASAWNAGGIPGFDKFASPFAAARLLGASPPCAWVVQGVAAAFAVAALVRAVRRRPGGAAEVALLVTATGFCVPFLGEYDLVILAVAGAWVIGEANRIGWLAYERIALGLLYLAPLAIKPAAVHGVPLAPISLLALAAVVLRRAWIMPAQARRLRAI
jgi:alpha-1,2-mannosyltransferase